MAITPSLRHGKSTTLQRLEVRTTTAEHLAKLWGLHTGECRHVNQSEEKTGAKMTCNSYMYVETRACHLLFVQGVSKVLVTYC